MTGHRTRLLVAGVGPLPPERPDRLHAPGLRTWGIARELARAGHPVRLLVAAFGEDPPLVRRYDLAPGDAAAFPDGLRRELPAEGGAAGGLGALIKAEAREWGADAAIGSTDLMNAGLAAAGLDLPIWMDFNGDPMAERQLIAKAAGDDAPLDDQWALYAPALARADRVSGCSNDQCLAILGELACVGRLGRWTAEERLVVYMPSWPDWGDPDQTGPLTAAGESASPFVRGKEVPADAFLIVQTGGFNTWLDVESLLAALEEAMAGSEKIHFAATGGAIRGHYEGGFERFQKLAAASRFKERIHLLGWRPLAEVRRLLAEGDLGLNLDLPGSEGILGNRTRLIDWIAAGLPTVTSVGCEFAAELADGEFATAVPQKNPAAAARAILAAAADPAPGRKAARRGAQWLFAERSAVRCLRPLLEWADAPKPAPDLREWRKGGATPPRLWRQASQAPENLAELRRQARRSAWLEQKLARMEGSRWVRLALKLRGKRDLDRPPEDSTG